MKIEVDESSKYRSGVKGSREVGKYTCLMALTLCRACRHLYHTCSGEFYLSLFRLRYLGTLLVLALVLVHVLFDDNPETPSAAIPFSFLQARILLHHLTYGKYYCPASHATLPDALMIIIDN